MLIEQSTAGACIVAVERAVDDDGSAAIENTAAVRARSGAGDVRGQGAADDPYRAVVRNASAVLAGRIGLDETLPCVIAVCLPVPLQTDSESILCNYRKNRATIAAGTRF